MKPNTDYVSAPDADEMSLGDLIALAERTVAGYHTFGRWQENYYDPAKSALVDLLESHGVIVCDRHGGKWGEDETCERCTDEGGSRRHPWEPGPLGPGAQIDRSGDEK